MNILGFIDSEITFLIALAVLALILSIPYFLMRSIFRKRKAKKLSSMSQEELRERYRMNKEGNGSAAGTTGIGTAYVKPDKRDW